MNKLSTGVDVCTSTKYELTLRPQARPSGFHGMTRCVPLSTGSAQRSRWDAGCTRWKPLPEASQKPTSMRARPCITAGDEDRASSTACRGGKRQPFCLKPNQGSVEKARKIMGPLCVTRAGFTTLMRLSLSYGPAGKAL